MANEKVVPKQVKKDRSPRDTRDTGRQYPPFLSDGLEAVRDANC